MVTQGKNNKRGIGAGSQTPVPAKKAKKATPEKTGKIINLLHTHKQMLFALYSKSEWVYSLNLCSISVWHMRAYATSD